MTDQALIQTETPRPRTKAYHQKTAASPRLAFTTNEAASLLSLSRDTFLAAAAAAGVAGRRAGLRLVIFTRDDLDLILSRLPRAEAAAA